MLLRTIICLIICFLTTKTVFGQEAIKLEYYNVYSKEEFKLPRLTKLDSNKIVILIFIKDSYREENTWLRQIEKEHTIDTANVVIYKIYLPAICDTLPATKKIVINNLNLYKFPDHTTQIKFQIIIQANEKAKNWALNKLVARANLFSVWENEIPENISNPKKLKPAQVYSITDASLKDDFIFLISKSPEYTYLSKVQGKLQDSFLQLKRNFIKLDSLSKEKIKQKISIECGVLPNIFSTNPRMPATLCVIQPVIKYLRSLSINSPIYYSIGLGITKLDFESTINPSTMDLGYFSDEQGDKFKSTLINLQCSEKIMAKNYNLELGLNYLQNISANSQSKLQWFAFAGFQFGLNSKPEIRKFEIEYAKNLIETRQYQILNFDKLSAPAILKIESSDNFQSYSTVSSNIGLLVKCNEQLLIQISLLYRTSSSLANRQIPIIRKESEDFIYSPIIFSQQQLNINSIGFTISLGYDIH